MKLVINGKTAEVPEGGAGQEVYSTEETRIGIWIDGKPLYRKVIIYDSYKTANVDTVIYEGSQDEYIVNLNYSVIDNKSAIATYGNFYTNDKNYSLIQNIDANKIKIRVGEGWTPSKVQLIIEYTKTTDTAAKAVAEPAISIASDNTYKYSAIASTAAATFADEFEPNDMPGSEEVETPCPKNV